MANKRFVSKEVLDHDTFVEMSHASQILYVRYMLAADDDGFVSSPRSIRRAASIPDTAHSELRKLRYVIEFESGVIVMKHWGRQNKVQPSRHVPTSYVEEKKLLFTKPDGSYTDNRQDVDETSRSIDKISIDKNIAEAEPQLPEGSIVLINEQMEKALSMASLLVSLIQSNTPSWQMRGKIGQWAEDIEKIVRIDGRTWEQVEYMIRWVQADGFWQKNILSGKKLREKFNDLIPKLKPMQSKGRGFA